MSLPQRIRAFVQRNRGAVLRNAWQQAVVRVWVRYRLWRVIGPLMKPREPESWVFMGGCYNSGTTILREMIGAHPEVASLPREGVEMTDAFPDLEADGWVRMWFRDAARSDLSHKDPVALARRAKRDWSPWWRRGARVFIEKSIVHGAWMPTLDAGFPNAHFIGVIRNGYCVCEGIRRRARPYGAAREILGRDEYPIDEVGRQWVFANQVLMRDKSRVRNYREVHYEDFTARPVETLRALFAFIGVDPDAVTTEPDGTIVIGARQFRIRNQNAESLARLNDDDRVALGAVIDPLMKQLGYQEGGRS
ncbi:MAG: sulfotransferase [Alphaproteobacteria bacterium]|nr:sulfotransferase [Alphaproteobacteria bacterium]